MGIDKLEAAASSMRPLAPATARAVGDLIDDDCNRVRLDHTEIIGDDQDVGHGKRKTLATARQSAGKISDKVSGIEVRVIRLKPGGITRDNQIAVRLNDCIGGKNKVDSGNKLPARKTHWV